MENIRFEDVSFSYAVNDKAVLKNASFDIRQGEFCLVIGKSGAGKTTLLKLLKKEIAPAGKLTGKIVTAENVGYVAQNVQESIVTDRVRSELSFGLTNMGVDVRLSFPLRRRQAILICQASLTVISARSRAARSKFLIWQA